MPEQHANNLFNLLKSQIPWRQIQYYKKDRDKHVITPRMTYVSGSFYKNQGNNHPDWLMRLKENVEIVTQTDFNFIQIGRAHV